MLDYLHNIDIKAFWFINGLNNSIADYFFLVITQFGSGWVLAPLLTIIVLVKIRNSKKLKYVLLTGIIGMSVSGIVNNQVKIITDKQRPVKYFERYKEEIVKKEINNDTLKVKVHTAGPIYKNKSFPSGHTCSAFAAASFLALIFSGWWYLTFVIALLVGYSRVYLGQHFPSDVLAGAILGIFIMATNIKIFSKAIKNTSLDGDIK